MMRCLVLARIFAVLFLLQLGQQAYGYDEENLDESVFSPTKSVEILSQETSKKLYEILTYFSKSTAVKQSDVMFLGTQSSTNAGEKVTCSDFYLGIVSETEELLIPRHVAQSALVLRIKDLKKMGFKKEELEKEISFEFASSICPENIIIDAYNTTLKSNSFVTLCKDMRQNYEKKKEGVINETEFLNSLMLAIPKKPPSARKAELPTFPPTMNSLKRKLSSIEKNRSIINSRGGIKGLQDDKELFQKNPLAGYFEQENISMKFSELWKENIKKSINDYIYQIWDDKFKIQIPDYFTKNNVWIRCPNSFQILDKRYEVYNGFIYNLDYISDESIDDSELDIKKAIKNMVRIFRKIPSERGNKDGFKKN